MLMEEISFHEKHLQNEIDKEEKVKLKTRIKNIGNMKNTRSHLWWVGPLTGF